MSSTTFLLISITLIVDYPVNQAQPVTSEYVWPDECDGKSYCEHKPKKYPDEEIKALMEHVTMEYRFGNVENRDGHGEDVASCKKRHGMLKIYAIKDQNDTVRIVPQTEKFEIYIAVEECKNPGRVTDAEYLSKWALEKKEINCVQTMVPFFFPVLTPDRKSLESQAPKDGISLSCTGKILKRNPSSYNIFYQ